MAPAEGQPRRGREHGLAERIPQLQEPCVRREFLRDWYRPRGRWRHEGLVTTVSATPEVNSSTVPAAERRRPRSGFWAAAFAFLIVMAVATLPSPLYGLYRIRDHLSALTITVVFAIFAGSTIAVLLRDSSIATRLGRRGTMLAAVATMMVAMGVLAAWKDLPGLLIGRLVTGVSVGLAAGPAITYLVELRLRADPHASV